MTFGAPYWLWALAMVPLAAFFFFVNERRRRELLQRIVAARLMPSLAGNISHGRRRLKFLVLLLGLASLIASMARPQFGYTWDENKRKGRDVFIAIDTSKSMLSTDIVPNRLTRAKLAAQDIIMHLPGDRVGLIAFAGESFVQAPLTVDYSAVLDSLNELDTNIIPLGGTDIASVINEAAAAFDKSESGSHCLILFSDGEELDADGVAAAKAHAHDFRIFTVGIGSKEGSIIPVPDDDGGTSFVKDPEGQIVKSRLDEERLRQIAEATGGFYTHLQNGPEEMQKIIRDGLENIKEHDIDSKTSRKPIERYQWPLALGILLVVASLFIKERRRVPAAARSNTAAQAAALMFILLCIAHTASALPPNQGIELYNDQKYKDSYDSFRQQLSRNPGSQGLLFDLGAAAYKNGEYDKAIEAFSQAIASPDSGARGKAEYNLANTLCMRGAKQETKEMKLKDWNNAIQHYDEALKVDANDKDAAYNRDVVKKMIEDLNKPEPPQQQQKQDQQKKDQQNKDQKNQQKNQQDQKNQQGQQGQQGQQDQKKNDQNSGKSDQQQDNKQQSSDQKQQNSGNSQNDQQQQSQQQQQQQSSNGGQQNNSGQNKQDQQGQQNQQNNASSGKQDEQKMNQGQQEQPGQNDQQQNAQNSQPQNGNGAAGNQSQQQPQANTSQEPEKKYSGQIKEQQQGQQDQQGQPQDAQDAKSEEAYVPGQKEPMTREQAMRIVESEKEEEAKGVLNERKPAQPVLKDW